MRSVIKEIVKKKYFCRWTFTNKKPSQGSVKHKKRLMSLSMKNRRIYFLSTVLLLLSFVGNAQNSQMTKDWKLVLELLVPLYL